MAKPQTKRIELRCEACSKPFWTWHHYTLRGKVRFCSMACYRTGRIILPEERFRKLTGAPTETGCLPWTGPANRKGYGFFFPGGPRGQQVLAHRYAYEMANGPIPDGLHVLHRCDNPPCINPEHLFVGTNDDNMTDRLTKGRGAKGERMGLAKLTDDAVREIRKRYQGGNESHRSLAAAYGVNHRVIGKIVTGEGWKHVKPE